MSTDEIKSRWQKLREEQLEAEAQKAVRIVEKKSNLQDRVVALTGSHPEVEAAMLDLAMAVDLKRDAHRNTAIDVAYKKLEKVILPHVEGAAVAHQLARFSKHFLAGSARALGAMTY